MMKSLYPESYAKKLIKGPFYDIPKSDIDEYLALVNEPYATGDENDICEQPIAITPSELYNLSRHLSTYL